MVELVRNSIAKNSWVSNNHIGRGRINEKDKGREELG